jgi:anti-sigma regulatory factor (Ser/Thr protein kinase)
VSTTVEPAASSGFVHESLLYRDTAEFLAGVAGFVRDGLAHGEMVVVAEPRPRLEQLREVLGPAAEAVTLLDMAEIGGNPARILGMWADVLARAGGRVLRGVGEPAFPGRRPAELVECELHEHLLNRAFHGGPAWRLLCPYDQGQLPAAVCAGALRTHPQPTGPGRGPAAGDDLAAFAAPLPPPATAVLRGEYRAGDVPAVRRTVRGYARSAGLGREQVEALELAASELATNSIRHGGGSGRLALWTEEDAAVVEFTDAGHLTDPLTGRRRPPPDSAGGRGLYLVNQLCDLVQLRSSPAGTTVRITTWR